MNSDTVLEYENGKIEVNTLYHSDNTTQIFMVVRTNNSSLKFEVEIYSESTDFQLGIPILEPVLNNESKEHPLYPIMLNILDAVKKNDGTLLNSDAIILLNKIYYELEIRDKIRKDLCDMTFVYTSLYTKSANKI